jgi:hypothetical protein
MLRTDVDNFLELVKSKGRVSLAIVAKELKISLATVQAWTDFLVEEKVLGIEYKFTTPYVFMNVDNKDEINFKNYIHFDTREEFYKKATERGLDNTQIKLLWLKYLNHNKRAMQNLFYEKANERGIPKEKIEDLWKKYFNYIEGGN